MFSTPTLGGLLCLFQCLSPFPSSFVPLPFKLMSHQELVNTQQTQNKPAESRQRDAHAILSIPLQWLFSSHFRLMRPVSTSSPQSSLVFFQVGRSYSLPKEAFTTVCSRPVMFLALSMWSRIPNGTDSRG